MKSDSSNSILKSFDKPLDEGEGAVACVRYLLRLSGADRNWIAE
jgi:hypothetical protein